MFDLFLKKSKQESEEVCLNATLIQYFFSDFLNSVTGQKWSGK